MPKVGETCTHCHDGQLLSNDNGDLSCIQCGNIVYAEAPASYDTDRRSRTDNRQVSRPFGEYRKAMSAEEFKATFEDILDEKTLKELMEEPS